MPFGDWQFYVVTTIALAGLWALARTVLPARRKKPTRTTLTIEGRKAIGRRKEDA